MCYETLWPNISHLTICHLGTISTNLYAHTYTVQDKMAFQWLFLLPKLLRSLLLLLADVIPAMVASRLPLTKLEVPHSCIQSQSLIVCCDIPCELCCISPVS